MKKYYILPFLFINYLISMEPPEDSLLVKKYIIIQDYYGDCFKVPTKQALQLSFIENYLLLYVDLKIENEQQQIVDDPFNEETILHDLYEEEEANNSYYDGFANKKSKEISFKGADNLEISSFVPSDISLNLDISFYQQEIHNNIHLNEKEIADKVHTTRFTKKLLKGVLKFVNNKTPHSYDNQKCRDLIFVAEYLGASKDVIREIVQSIPDHSLVDYQTRVHIKEYSNTIQEIVKNRNINFVSPKLRCNYNNLDTLFGIAETFPNKNLNKNFTRIKLNNNNLKQLNLKELLKLFPNLEKLDASNNLIQKLILPKTLPKNFKLNLSNNMIKNIELFNADGAHINLSNNPLTTLAKQNLEKAKLPSFSQEYKHYSFIAKKILSASLRGGWKCGYAGLGIGMTQEFTWRHKILYALYVKFNRLFDLDGPIPQVYVGAPIYAISKILQYNGCNLSSEYNSCINYAEKWGICCALIGMIGNPLTPIIQPPQLSDPSSSSSYPYYYNPSKYKTPTIIFDA
jgi:hypothetical protein